MLYTILALLSVALWTLLLSVVLASAFLEHLNPGPEPENPDLDTPETPRAT